MLDFLFAKAIDKRLARYQNELVEKHFDEVNNLYDQIRGWRHDYHNHMQMIIALLETTDDPLSKKELLVQYLNELNSDLESIDYIVRSNNLMVDAILNSKISLATSKGIEVNVKATVPEEVKIQDIDLSIIIGNLIDNAVEACLKIEHPEDRFLRIYIGLLKGQLYISISNSVSGKAKKTQGKYLTTKASSSHGFGLKRIDKIVEKYHGYINRQDEEGVFVTEIMLPI